MVVRKDEVMSAGSNNGSSNAAGAGANNFSGRGGADSGAGSRNFSGVGPIDGDEEEYVGEKLQRVNQ